MSVLDELFSKRAKSTTLEDAARNFSLMQAAVKALGNPQFTFPSVHVTGTNGKGSVAFKLARTLKQAGYRVGLFTSPHIARASERIQINDIEIPQAVLEKKAELFMRQFPDLHFFNYITLVALQYFAEKDVDIAIVETGIGGKFDSTNCIQPILSIITSIALDHTELLGSTLEEIAAQKAGIIRPGVPVLLGPRVQHIDPPYRQVKRKNEDYDVENKEIVFWACLEIADRFPTGVYYLEENPPCRFEKIGRFVLDVAHNPAGIEALLRKWDIHHPDKPVNVIVGLSMDKDLAGCLKPLANRAEHLFLVQADSLRAAPISALERHLLPGQYTACSSMKEAVALASAREPDILISGSFFIMQEARDEILRLEVGSNDPLLSRGEPAR